MNLASKIAVGITAAVLTPSAAFAADPIFIPPSPPPPPIIAPAVMDWTGPYLGVILGYGTGTKFWDNNPYGAWGTTTHNVRGVLAGVEAGFRFGAGLVVGVEADWAWTNANGASACGPAGAYNCATDLDWLATVTGQLGFGAGNVLPYVEGGLALARENFTVTGPGLGTPLTGSITNRGWVVGGGVVFAMDTGLYFKAEYNFMNFGTFVGANANNGVVGADFDLTQRVHVFKIGVGFMF